MYNIIIDTCSLQNLLKDEEENKLLDSLKYLSDNHYIKLFTHEEIIEEWNNNKIKEMKKYSMSAKTKYAHAKDVIKKEKLGIYDFPKPNIGYVEKQIRIIDVLIQTATKLITPDRVKIICAERSKHKEPPYHGKISSNSTVDAYIIFTALDFFSEKKQEFIFVSSNTSDFSGSQNQQEKIHPKIQEEYSHCRVQYYSKIGKCITDILKELGLENQIKSDVSLVKPLNSEIKILIDTNKSDLDQLYDYIKLIYKEINFVPIHILIKNHPLKISPDSPYPYYSLLTLYLDNDKLFNLFESIHVDRDKGLILETNTSNHSPVNSYSKFNFIIKKLNDNLISFISHRNSKSQNVSIQLSEPGNCDCVKCCFLKLNFGLLSEELKNSQETLQDCIKYGYIYSKIGNFDKAVLSFQKANDLAKKNDNPTLFFITKFNLLKLLPFIKNYLNDVPGRTELIKNLEQIRIEKIRIECKRPENHEIIDWIFFEKFHHHFVHKINGFTNKIIDQYYSSINGGRSINGHIKGLILEYAQYVDFISKNWIVYDQFVESYDLDKTFIEGVIASHATEGRFNSKLNKINDWILRRMSYKGEADHILKMFRRYRLKQLIYKKGNNEIYFLSICLNFFSNDLSKNQNLFKNNHFQNYCNRLYGNLLTLLAYIQLNKKFVNVLVPHIIRFHENEDFINPHNVKYLRLFISRQGKLIYNYNLKELFTAFVRIGKWHEISLFETISDVILTKKINVSLTKKNLNSLIHLIFDTCEVCERTHQRTFAIPLLRILKEGQKKDMIVNKLDHSLKNNFDFDLYYQARIYDLIESKEDFWNKSILECIPKKIRKKNTVFGYDQSPVDQQLNAFLNLYFKNKVTLLEKHLEIIKSLNAYYSWLMDMESFDYSKFEVVWIMEYPTKFYYERIAGCNSAKIRIEKYLKNNVDLQIQRYYLDIYVRKAWESKNIK